VIFAVLDVSWTMGLNSDKTSKVFLLFFYQILFYFCTTVTQSSRFYHNCGCFWSLHPKNQNFHCAVSSNDQYQENGFAADVLIGLKSRPNRSHRKRIYSISNIGNMMGCDHPSCKVGPLAGELWHFEYFPTTTVRHFEL